MKVLPYVMTNSSIKNGQLNLHVDHSNIKLNSLTRTSSLTSFAHLPSRTQLKWDGLLTSSQDIVQEYDNCPRLDNTYPSMGRLRCFDGEC